MLPLQGEDRNTGVNSWKYTKDRKHTRTFSLSVKGPGSISGARLGSVRFAPVHVSWGDSVFLFSTSMNNVNRHFSSDELRCYEVSRHAAGV